VSIVLPGRVFPKPIQPQNQTYFAACDWSAFTARAVSTVAKVGQRAVVVYWAIWRISIVGSTLPSGYIHDEDIQVKGTFCERVIGQ